MAVQKKMLKKNLNWVLNQEREYFSVTVVLQIRDFTMSLGMTTEVRLQYCRRCMERWIVPFSCKVTYI